MLSDSGRSTGLTESGHGSLPMPFRQSRRSGGCALLDVELDERVEAGIVNVALDVDCDGAMNLCVSGSGSCALHHRSGSW